MAIKYALYSTFLELATNSHFVPLKSTKVFVEVYQVKTNDDVNLSQCPDCVKYLIEFEIVDKVSAINWRQIETFNLKLRVVSYY